MTGMDPFTTFSPEVFKELKARGPQTMPVTIEVEGEKKIIGEATVTVDEKGIHITPTILDEEYEEYVNLISPEPKTFSLSVEKPNGKKTKK